MRHKKSGRKLNRNSSHRKAMFRNMAKAVLTFETIRTTEAKAKELRGVVDGLITLALKNDLHARREAYRILGNHRLVQRLFDEVGPRFIGGQGGYTRIIKLSQPRVGDSAPMVVFELTKLGEKVLAKAEAKTEAPKAVKAEENAEAKPVAEAKPKAAKPKAAAAKPKVAKPKAPKAAAEAKPAKPKAAKPKAQAPKSKKGE